MKRSEYMSKLNEALEIFGEDVKKEIVEDYEEHYEIGLQNGKSEDQISEELGDIEELVKELRKSEAVESKRTDKKITLEKVNGEAVGKEAKSNESEKKHMNEEQQTMNSDSWVNENKVNNNMPRKVEVRSKFAHVEVTTSMDNQIHLDWVNYQESRARDYYEFRSWMEGSNIYGELCKKSVAGLFVPMFNGDVRIKVQIPKGFPEVEIISLSGDTVMHDVELQSAQIRSASGDIEVERSNANQMTLDTKSGNIICKEGQTANLNQDTKSGDISFFNIQSSSIRAHSLSGDVRGNNLTGDLSVSTASGDVQVAASVGRQYDFYSISGEVEIKHVQGESMKMDTKSGDIKAEICVGSFAASSISGDVEIENSREGNFTMSSVSGDIEFNCHNIAGYAADVHSVSGKISCSYQDRRDKKLGNSIYTYGAGTSKIKAKTTSGNIDICA